MTFNEPRERGEGRKKLEALEKEGKYVFHGSLNDISVIKPCQGYDDAKGTGEMAKDGDPAVFASPFADVAIFRSLINPESVRGSSRSKWGMADDGTIIFQATKNLLNAAAHKIGKVYVLDKGPFGELKGTEVRSNKEVVPREIIEVYAEDLPKNIQIIEF